MTASPHGFCMAGCHSDAVRGRSADIKPKSYVLGPVSEGRMRGRDRPVMNIGYASKFSRIIHGANENYLCFLPLLL